VSNNKKSKLPLIIVITVVSVIVLAVVTIGLLTYFDKVKISFVNDIFVSMGLKENAEVKNENSDNSDNKDKFTEEDLKNPYEVTPPDADDYFDKNTSVKSEIKANESDDVRSEEDVYDDFSERGFDSNPITAEYDMNGKYYAATEISRYSSEKHPMYQTYYITSNGDVWMIFEINGAVIANPLSYNEQTQKGVQLMLSESNTITSYDSTKNKFYINVPNADVLSVKKVDKINAETLENLTNKELDRL
jgi:hypothetical protein